MDDHDAIVKLTEAADEPEAAMICGFLASRGIQATYDKGTIETAPGTWLSGPFVGRQEIVVRAEDLEAAREALAGLEARP